MKGNALCCNSSLLDITYGVLAVVLICSLHTVGTNHCINAACCSVGKVNKKLRERRQNSASVIVFRLMLYTRLASPVAVCIAIRGRYTQLAWLANPNPNPTNFSYG